MSRCRRVGCWLVTVLAARAGAADWGHGWWGHSWDSFGVNYLGVNYGIEGTGKLVPHGRLHESDQQVHQETGPGGNKIWVDPRDDIIVEVKQPDTYKSPDLETNQKVGLSLNQNAGLVQMGFGSTGGSRRLLDKLVDIPGEKLDLWGTNGNPTHGPRINVKSKVGSEMKTYRNEVKDNSKRYDKRLPTTQYMTRVCKRTTSKDILALCQMLKRQKRKTKLLTIKRPKKPTPSLLDSNLFSMQQYRTKIKPGITETLNELEPVKTKPIKSKDEHLFFRKNSFRRRKSFPTIVDSVMSSVRGLFLPAGPPERGRTYSSYQRSQTGKHRSPSITKYI